MKLLKETFDQKEITSELRNIVDKLTYKANDMTKYISALESLLKDPELADEHKILIKGTINLLKSMTGFIYYELNDYLEYSIDRMEDL